MVKANTTYISWGLTCRKILIDHQPLAILSMSHHMGSTANFYLFVLVFHYMELCTSTMHYIWEEEVSSTYIFPVNCDLPGCIHVSIKAACDFKLTKIFRQIYMSSCSWNRMNVRLQTLPILTGCNESRESCNTCVVNKFDVFTKLNTIVLGTLPI